MVIMGWNAGIQLGKTNFKEGRSFVNSKKTERTENGWHKYPYPKKGFFVDAYGDIVLAEIIGEDPFIFITEEKPSGICIGFHKSRLKGWSGYQLNLFA